MMTRFEGAVMQFNREIYPQVIATIVAFMTMAWGATLILAPQLFSAPSTVITFSRFTPPTVWGVIFILLAEHMVLSVWKRSGWALLTTFVLMTLWCIWAATVAWSLRSGGMPPWISTAFSLVLLAQAVLFAVERRRGR